MERLRGWMERLRKIAPERFVLLGLLLAAVVLWGFVLLAPPRALQVTAFAVGEGDALLIRAPSGRTVLIDGGSRTMPNVGDTLVPNLLLAGVHRLDAILITHPDSDHLSALPAVMDALPVGMLLDPEIPCETDTYRTVLATAEQKHVPRYRVCAGDCLNLGAGTSLRILAPGATLLQGTGADDNNNCVVCLLALGHARMLFTGDLERAGEVALLQSGQDIHADVLKVAHHGSRNGSSDEFLQAVDPSKAVISTQGAASRDLEPVLKRLEGRGIEVLRTDVHGQIRLQTDGERWQVWTKRVE